jgi:hypothetical protein
MKSIGRLPLPAALLLVCVFEGAESLQQHPSDGIDRRVQRPKHVCSRSHFLEKVIAATSSSTAGALEVAFGKWRRSPLLLTTTVTAGVTVTVSAKFVPAVAFEGGVGGLGKTKPETGVKLLEGLTSIQNAAGIVSAELIVNGSPVRVEFTAPWPLLVGSSGLEARDLQTSESAFVQVVDDVHAVAASASSVISSGAPTTAAMKELLLATVFSSQGKFAAYGSPVDVKVRKFETGDGLLYSVSFTTFTPGLRESERQVVINCRPVGSSSLVMLVVGTTAQRFKTHQDVIQRVAHSLQAYAAPETRRGR